MMTKLLTALSLCSQDSLSEALIEDLQVKDAII
jgi:hypothetical protein